MNVYECRIDSSKMLCDYRRPFCVAASSIGIWENFLRTIAWVSLATTGGLMAFTSSFVPRLVFWYQGHSVDPSDNDHKMAGFVNKTFPMSQLPSSFCEWRFITNDT